MRSDTVTLPTPAMRSAMAGATVDDDVLGHDPTVRLLEEKVADLCGKECGLFVPSGTMSNLIAMMSHCWERGSEYVVGDSAHIYLYEQGGAAQVGGAHPRVVSTASNGELPLDQVSAMIRPDDPHFPVTRCVAIESTHNMLGGIPLSLDYTEALGKLCREKKLALHIDGARLWHSSVALGATMSELCAPADSISLCLSKALGAPAGSVLVGDSSLRQRGKRLRKLLGGGMRQSGCLAAACIVALEEQFPDRLSEDHRRSKTLARGLSDIFNRHVEEPPTNLLFIDLEDSERAVGIVEKCKTDDDVHFLHVGQGRLRFVTHHQVTDEHIEQALKAIKKASVAL